MKAVKKTLSSVRVLKRHQRSGEELRPRISVIIKDRAGAGLRTAGEKWGRALSRHPTYPGFFRCLQHWYPPPDVMERADDTARSTLLSLHYKATESLEILNTQLA